MENGTLEFADPNPNATQVRIAARRFAPTSWQLSRLKDTSNSPVCRFSNLLIAAWLMTPRPLHYFHLNAPFCREALLVQLAATHIFPLIFPLNRKYDEILKAYQDILQTNPASAEVPLRLGSSDIPWLIMASKMSLEKRALSVGL
jgi:hypothetical protein